MPREPYDDGAPKEGPQLLNNLPTEPGLVHPLGGIGSARGRGGGSLSRHPGWCGGTLILLFIVFIGTRGVSKVLRDR